MIDFRDLFVYFKNERAGILQLFKKLSDEEFTKDRGLSFGSIKNVFVHTVIVEDAWIHYRIAGVGTYTPHIPEDYASLNDVKKYVDEVDEKTERFFHALTDDMLNRELEVSRTSGRERVEKIEDVLYHIPIEVIHHYGEIFAELWKINIDVPYYSYLDYKREKKAS
jgi:uncharacterized damage-inducible protein DinB